MFLFLKEHKTIFGACVLNRVRVWCVCVHVCVSTCDSSYRIPSFLPRPSTAVCACALAGNADMLYERCFYKLQSVFVSPYTNYKTKGSFTLNESESDHESERKRFQMDS